MVHDKGPWSARIDEQGRMRICSEDFTHDVELILTGDFADVKQQAEYAANIIARLTSPEGRESLELRWRDCSVTLPCDGDRVVVLYGDTPEVARYRPSPEFRWHTPMGYLSNEDVTHWMPLPRLPQADADATCREACRKIECENAGKCLRLTAAEKPTQEKS